MALSCTAVANPTVVNEVSDEKLKEVHTHIDGAAQLLNGGRTYETIQRMSFQCALGKSSYSLGIHRIRIKIHYGSAFFGIRSRNIWIEPDIISDEGQYQRTPSTYGWFTNCRRVLNGRLESHRLQLFSRQDAIFASIVNCDERLLTIVINEDSMERDEMEVDGLHAPFPWCLFVQLNRIGARVSLV